MLESQQYVPRMKTPSKKFLTRGRILIAGLTLGFGIAQTNLLENTVNFVKKETVNLWQTFSNKFVTPYAQPWNDRIDHSSIKYPVVSESTIGVQGLETSMIKPGHKNKVLAAAMAKAFNQPQSDTICGQMFLSGVEENVTKNCILAQN